MWSPVEFAGVGGSGAGHGAPCARGKHSATLLGGHVYVLGGRGAGGALPLRDFWRYTLATGVWERLQCRGEPPPALQEHTATAHDHRIYVFGGEATALSSETPLWIYDTETQFWRKLPGRATCSGPVRRGARALEGAGPSGRRGHSAHALKDCLLIYGGYKDLRGSTNELWAFHYESESWQQVRTAAPGPARHRHAAALHDARLYVHAGQCDLRACHDLWTYDTISRVWSAVRPAGKAAPGARGGHAAARAGAHLYVFGGDAGAGDHHANDDMWRFHFATETWERIAPSTKWPAARVDARALLVALAPSPGRPPRLGGEGAGAGGAAGAGGEAGAGAGARGAGALLARLSSFQVRRRARCAYSVLGERDSAESSPRGEAARAINKSRSAHHLHGIARRQPADGAADADADAMTRDPISVPDFAAAAPATKLVYLDSDSEEELRRERTIVAMPKSASVRFRREPTTDDEEAEAEFSTSDYASAERVNRAPAAALGFSNPHYLGPDIAALGALGAALTPDSGLGPGDIELQDLSARRVPAGDERDGRDERDERDRRDGRVERLHLLLVGGREPPHLARLQGPLSMWTYRLL